MDRADIEAAIEDGIPDAEARVTRPRVHNDEEEDAHYAAEVVSPAFADESIVDRHQMVWDTIGDVMTREIHALEISTYTPEEHDGDL
jgi:stress-induced morphogen